MYRKISAIVVPTLIAIGIIAYMLYRVWGDLLVALEHMVPAYLIVAVAICLVAWVLRGWRYRMILKSLEYDVPVTRSTACIFVSQTANLVVPARLGDFVRVFILNHEYKTTYSEGVSSIVVERVFDIIMVALLGAVSLPFVLNVPPWFYTLIILPIVAGALFFAFLIFFRKLQSEESRFIEIMLAARHEIERRTSMSVRSVFYILSAAFIGVFLLSIVLKDSLWFDLLISLPLGAGAMFMGFLLVTGKSRSQNRYVQVIRTMLGEIHRASLTIRSVIFLSVSSLVIWLLDVLACLAVVMMFGQQVTFAVVVLAIVIGNLVKAVPLTPGGVGTYELSLALTFELAGVSPAVATLIAVIDHLIKNLVTLAGGIISIYLFGDWVVPSIKKALTIRLDGGDTAER
jgi:uncharacterized membrane protein YbhN (UPF0104 family)